MKIIKYIDLFTYIIQNESEWNPIAACKIIQKIRHLPIELKDAVLKILEGKTPDISYHDISLLELIERDNMKPIRAILMLDWIRKEPAIAMRYMERDRLRAPQTISQSDKEMLQQVLKKLKVNQNNEELNDEDIVIEDK